MPRIDTSGNVDITSAAGDITAPTLTVTGAASVTATTIGAGYDHGERAEHHRDGDQLGEDRALLARYGLEPDPDAVELRRTLTDALTNGVGDLVDADLAAESAQLQALQTKQQLGIQSLSIANQGPGAVLTLFR